MNSHPIDVALAALCFGYPYVFAWYWMIGGLMFQWLRERGEPPYDAPPPLADYPLVSILVPCYNEEAQAHETFAALGRIDYPAFEIVAINDGSIDGTRAMLDSLARRDPRMRVIHLERNVGKATALNFGAVAAKHELLVCVDGDTLVDRHAITWFVRSFQRDPGVGAVTGNPRIRSRSTLLGRLQVGEFSCMVGLIKRAQGIYGPMFTVSGAICAFRKRALQDAGWWSPRTLTDDVDVSWRLQMSGWSIAFEPKALAWILTTETLRGLWRQRLRWSEGGSSVALHAFPHLFRYRGAHMWPLWLNWLVSMAWAYSTVAMFAVWMLDRMGFGHLTGLKGFPFLPAAGGALLAFHYFLQAAVAAWIDRRYEPKIERTLFWVVWYPLAFWLLSALTSIVGLPRALLRLGHDGRWTSPDRGLRP